MLRHTWSTAVRMMAAFALTATTRAIVVRREEAPSALYAGAVQDYERARPSVFVDEARGYDSFRDLERDADAVLTGRLAPADASIPGADGGTFDTLLTLDADLVFKTTAGIGDRIVVRQPGGLNADGSPRSVAGDPPFRPGMTYLLFLRRGFDDRYRVLGGAAGRLIVVQGRIYALSTVYHDGQIFDTGASGVALDVLMRWLGLAGPGLGPQAVMPGRESPFVPTRQGDEIG